MEDEHALQSTEQQPAASRPPAGRSREPLLVGALLLILLLAGFFRFSGIDWDGTQHLHPDERFLTDTTSLLQTTLNPLTYLRTSESPLNPYNVNKPLYVYGNFPMTVVRFVSEQVAATCDSYLSDCLYNYATYNGIHIVGRALSALLDLVAVTFIFLIGRRLYDWRVGLLAALFQALAVMPIQQSHFYTMDNWAAGLTAVTMYMAVRAAEQGERKRWWVLFGLFLGLTVASRINMAPLAAMAGVAALIWLARQGDWRTLTGPGGGLKLQHAALGVLIAAIASIITFRLAQPYAFADAAIVQETALRETGRSAGPLTTAIGATIGFNPQWLNNMEEIQRLQSPEASFPPALQWTDRTKMLFPITNMILYGMGITASLIAFAGFFWALWQIARQEKDWTRHTLPVAWIGLYFLFMGTRWVQSIRYFLPLYPFFFLLGAWALTTLWDRAGRSLPRRAAAGALILAALLPSLLWANAFVDIYRQPVTRVAASRWMLEHVNSGATLLYEADGVQKALQLPLRDTTFFPDRAPLTLNVRLPVDGVVTGIRFNYLSDPDPGPDPETLIVNLNAAPNFSSGQVTLGLGAAEESAFVPLDPIPLQAEQTYPLVIISGDGGTIAARTSIIANEHWDDPLPVRVDGLDPYGQFFRGWSGGTIPVTTPDNEEKRQQILSWLEEADYLVLSSQRAIWSLPRLPLTYPLMMSYYEGLFDGSLGFELIGQFHADLHVGPLYISDTGGEVAWGAPPEIGWPPPGDAAAEEAFSVYDHPPVWIFAKRADYDPQQVAARLNGVDLTRQVTMNPGEATVAPNGLLLDQEALALQRENGSFAETFNVDGPLSRYPALGAVVWWLAVVALGWLAFPITFVVFGGLPSRGYAFSRVLALLLISYLGWLAASLRLLPNTQGTLLLSLLAVVLTSAAIAWHRRRELATFVRRNLPFLGLVELLSLALFLFLILIRLGNPDVWDVIWGGEKPMNMAYFTATLKSTTFPPYDPWFAGGYINYYYYGYVFVGALTQLLGVVPAVAYNLILPMLFSFTGMGAFTVAHDLVAWRAERREPAGGPRLLDRRALLAGGTALLLCVMLGNLAELGVVFDAWQRAGSTAIATGSTWLDGLLRTLDGAVRVLFRGQPSPIYPGDWFWTASRALNYNPGEAAPITEFPFFTFLYGDLHAHMISMPLMLLALGWSVGLALRGNRPVSRFESLLFWLSGGIAIGVLRATNTWDWPTYLVIGALAVIFAAYRQHRRFSGVMLGQAALQSVALLLLATVTFLPFALNYGQGYSSLSLWPGSYTAVGNYLVVYGLFLFLLLTYLIWELRQWTRGWTREGLQRQERRGPLIVGGALLHVLLVVVMLLRGYYIAPLVFTLVVVAGLLGLRPGLPAARRVVLVLISAALFLTLAVEIVVLDGDIGRMNMVFKFYVQVWLILSVAAGCAVAWAWPAVRRSSRTPRLAWHGVLATLLFIAALYPLLATAAKWDIRMSDEAPLTLDGLAFMTTTRYGDINNSTVELASDYEAIQWMQRNIDGSPVIAEAHGSNPYRSIANRVANYTGLPAIVGWDWHQRQQRAVVPSTQVTRRIQDVNNLYNSTSMDVKLDIIAQYDVEFIYAGTLEWIYYSPAGLNVFDDMVDRGYLEEVYRSSEVSIYHVLDTVTANAAP